MQTLPKCSTVVNFWNLLPIMISFTFAAQTRVDWGVVSKLVIHWQAPSPTALPARVNTPTTAPRCETHFLAHFEIQMFWNQPFSLHSSCTKPTAAAVNPKMVEVSTFSYHSKEKTTQNQNSCLSILLQSGFYMKQVWNTWGFSTSLANSSQTFMCVHTGCTEKKKKVSWQVAMQGMFSIDKVTFRELKVLAKVLFLSLARLV